MDWNLFRKKGAWLPEYTVWHAIGRAVALVAAVVSTSGCSMKYASTSRTLHISFPNAPARSSLGKRSAASMASMPTALSDFTCFGLRVTGPGISDDPRLGCSMPGTIGILGGLVSTNGGGIDLSVPTGQSRRIDVFALTSSEGCTILDDVLGRSPSTRFANFSSFYLIGSTTVDVASDVDVSIKVTFNSQTSVKIFDGCPGWTPVAANPTPTATPTVYLRSVEAGGASIAAGASRTLSGGAVQARVMIGQPFVLPGNNSAGNGAAQILFFNDVNGDETSSTSQVSF